MSAIDRTLVAKAIAFDASVILTGSAVVLVAKGNANRCIEIQNLGSGAIGITFTGTTPLVGTKGTITIPAGATWRSFEGFIPYSDLYVIGPSGTNVTCWYY